MRLPRIASFLLLSTCPILGTLPPVRALEIVNKSDRPISCVLVLGVPTPTQIITQDLMEKNQKVILRFQNPNLCTKGDCHLFCGPKQGAMMVAVKKVQLLPEQLNKRVEINAQNVAGTGPVAPLPPMAQEAPLSDKIRIAPDAGAGL